MGRRNGCTELPARFITELLETTDRESGQNGDRRFCTNHPSLIRRPAAGCFLGGVMRFVGEHPLLGGAAAPAFLTAELLEARAPGLAPAFLECLDFVEQKMAGEKPVQPLLARVLAFDLHPRRAVPQHHAGGSLVDVLPAVSAGTDERFVHVRLAHAQRTHAPGELIGLLRVDG